MSKKVCRECREEIHRKAGVCPHCRSRQGLSRGVKLVLTFILLVGFAAALTDNSDPATATRGHSTSPAPQPGNGREAVSPGPRRYVVIDDEGPAPVRWTAGSTNPKSVMARIPIGKRVEVHDERVDRRGGYPVIYYEVGEGIERGWISQYTTTLQMITVDPKTGKETVRRQPNGAQELARGSK